MRFFMKFSAAILTFALGVTAAGVWALLVPSSQLVAATEIVESESITITPIMFLGWSTTLVPPGQIPAEQNTSPAFFYRKLDIWYVDVPSRADRIDLVCYVTNRGTRPVDLAAIAIGEFSVSNRGESPRPGISTVLTERQNIGQQVLTALAPGETRQLQFSNFDLKTGVEKYLRKEFGSLRPWDFHVTVNLQTLDGQPLGNQQGVLPLVRGRDNSKSATQLPSISLSLGQGGAEQIAPR